MTGFQRSGEYKPWPAVLVTLLSDRRNYIACAINTVVVS